jgi:hypothetical protein
LPRNIHIGETNSNNRGSIMMIIENLGYSKYLVEFQDNYKYRTEIYYQNFKSGNVWNPYDKTICGVGFIGVGKYKTGTSKKKTDNYRIWENLIYRCYGEKFRDSRPAYKGCTVCQEWHNFQNFAQWYDENFYDCGEGRMHIDKDIIIKDNKLYSPETCILVPQRINMIFMTKSRKDDLPNCVRQNPSGSYASYYNGKRYGTYRTLQEAVNEHEKQKRIHIIEVAEEYKNKIPLKVYEALINYCEELAA